MMGAGIPAKMKQLSRLRNPLIAEALHRTGAVEVWGQGINRVSEMCGKHGPAPPVFEEKQRFLVVTFRAQLVAGCATGTPWAESGDQVGTKSGPSGSPAAFPPRTGLGGEV